MAQTSVLFPVPLGPMTMFKLGPGKNSTAVYVTKFSSLTRTIAPGWCFRRDGRDCKVSGRDPFVLAWPLVRGVPCTELELWPLRRARLLFSLGGFEKVLCSSSDSSSSRDRLRGVIIGAMTGGVDEGECSPGIGAIVE